jgi:hypothetical protein
VKEINHAYGKVNCRKVKKLRKVNKLRKVSKLAEKVNALTERERGFGATH